MFDDAQEETVELPHPIAVEVEARRVIRKSYAYWLTDPERVLAAYRIVARNRCARRIANDPTYGVEENDPTYGVEG